MKILKNFNEYDHILNETFVLTLRFISFNEKSDYLNFFKGLQRLLLILNKLLFYENFDQIKDFPF